MRIVFMGTPEFAVPSLDALVAAGHDVRAVYSQPPRAAGRKLTLKSSPVHERAEALGIPVFTPSKLRDEAIQAEFAGHGADVAVVAAYGLILPQPVLDAPRLGCINIHASILPRWRGAAPVQRAILAGDAETGVTVMQMEAGLDTGPMRAVVRTPTDRKTAPELTRELSQLGATLLVEVLDRIDAYPAEPQPAAGVTHAAKIDKGETQLDFLVSAPQVERQIRAFAPTAWFAHGGERIRIVAADVVPPASVATAHPPATVIDDSLTIACNPGAIRPVLVQRAGKAVMTPDELLRGYSLSAGTRLA